MGLQLQHVFAGERVGRGKVQRQALVYGVAARIWKRQVGGMPGLQRLTQPRLRKACEVLAADPHHTDGAAPGRTGDGDDGVGGWGRHRLINQTWAN